MPGLRRDLASDPSAWTEDDDRVADSHFDYLQEGLKDGKVVLAGRSQDGVGPAIVIINAAGESESRQFMEKDPFISSGLFVANLQPFRVALS